MSVCRWLFEVGASADITRSDNSYTPMYAACQEGHLSVCQWLFEVGASVDITRANIIGETPMYAACWNGHLSVCQWLFEWARPQTSPDDNHGDTPMEAACLKGHLSVCQWLFEVGASADITKANNHWLRSDVRCFP